MSAPAPDPTAEPPSIRFRDWLFDPFTYVAGARSLAIGLAAILLAGLIASLSNSHFDGVLDFHTGAPAPLPLVFLEGIANWLALTVVLLILGKLVSRTAFRAIDLLGTQAMARWPTAIASIAALTPAYRRSLAALLEGFRSSPAAPHLGSADLAVFGLAAVVVILAMIWMVVLMYRSFSICCNIKGAKAAVTFAVGLLVAEVVSKIALVRLFLA